MLDKNGIPIYPNDRVRVVNPAGKYVTAVVNRLERKFVVVDSCCDTFAYHPDEVEVVE